MIAGIHHVQVTVPSDRLEDARAFYRDVLGLPAGDRPTGAGWRPNGVWFDLPDGRQLHVGVEDGVERKPTRAHAAYAVADLPAALERLRAAGCECQTDDEPHVPVIPGWRRFQTRDPFGNQLEFISRDARDEARP